MATQSVKRQFSNAPWEEKIAYCRSIRYGNHISVAGTASVGEGGGTYAPERPYEQTQRCLKLIEATLQKWGAGLQNVVRTRIYVTDISQWREYGRAHREAFKDFPPATSMIEVKGLIAPGMMVEIEAEAFLPE